MKPGIYYLAKTDELYVYEGGDMAYTEYVGCTLYAVITSWWTDNAEYVGEL